MWTFFVSVIVRVPPMQTLIRAIGTRAISYSMLSGLVQSVRAGEISPNDAMRVWMEADRVADYAEYKLWLISPWRWFR